MLSPDNAKIGEVTDILFDERPDRSYVSESIGDSLRLGSKDVAVAPSSFDVVPGSNGSADKVKLSMMKDQLKQAQNFQPYRPPHPSTTGSSPGGSPR